VASSYIDIHTFGIGGDLFFDIAALSVTFLFPQKKSNQKKTPGCACFFEGSVLLLLVWLPNQTMPVQNG